MKPELLAPAGNLEKLKWAAAYGADAVYFGTKFGSLRSFAGNFTFDQAAQGVQFLHKLGKKAYATLNIYPFSDEYDKVAETAKTLDDIGVDAIIAADMGVITELGKLNLKAAIHVSTQANTTSYQAAMAYKNLGAKRVNLARELSLEQIEEIAKKTKDEIETEVFIHGSVCFSYSGRCAISDYMTGYRANRGECKHPCRWKYSVVEEKRPGEYIPVFEDQRGLYLFNTKELALFEFVPTFAQAGINSIKIEGRMKSIHYIATTVSFYRQVLDGKVFDKEHGLELLRRIPNRGYSQGFAKGSFGPEDYGFNYSISQANSIFTGNILEEKIEGKCVVEVRNKILAGDKLEVLKPDGSLSEITMDDPLITKYGTSVNFVNNSQFLLINEDLPPYTVLRKNLNILNHKKQPGK